MSGPKIKEQAGYMPKPLHLFVEFRKSSISCFLFRRENDEPSAINAFNYPTHGNFSLDREAALRLAHQIKTFFQDNDLAEMQADMRVGENFVVRGDAA